MGFLSTKATFVISQMRMWVLKWPPMYWHCLEVKIFNIDEAERWFFVNFVNCEFLSENIKCHKTPQNGIKITDWDFSYVLLTKAIVFDDWNLKNYSQFLIFWYFRYTHRNQRRLRFVSLLLFFNNNHLPFGCQIITYGHHLSKNIIASQFSQFSFFAQFWRFGPYLSYKTQHK